MLSAVDLCANLAHGSTTDKIGYVSAATNRMRTYRGTTCYLCDSGQDKKLVYYAFLYTYFWIT
jgi:hypothetical protein